MRSDRWLTLGLALVLAAAAGRATAAEVATFGDGPAYDTLGRLAVLHQGRHKPIDTMARQVLKQIYDSETVTFRDAEGKATARWGHVGALLDITVRPEFWDEQ